jgi:hypothetical protein
VRSSIKLLATLVVRANDKRELPWRGMPTMCRDEGYDQALRKMLADRRAERRGLNRHSRMRSSNLHEA